MLESPETQRRIGRFAWAMAWAGLVLSPLHAMSRHNTVDGKEDLQVWTTRVWSDPGRKALAPLLDWADPDTVYLTYGKLWLPVFLGFTLAAFVVYRNRRPHGFERWAWRIALVGYVYACLSVALDYWTQLADYNAFFEPAFVIGLPGIPILMVGSTMVGITLLRRGFRPRATGWLLALAFPLAIGIVQFTSLGSIVLPVAFAFGIAGRRLARTTSYEQVAGTTGPDDVPRDVMRRGRRSSRTT
jgi:hypothetical protein